MNRTEQNAEIRERQQRHQKQLQKIARHYDRLEERLSELEAMLPEFEERIDAAHRPNKPR